MALASSHVAYSQEMEREKARGKPNSARCRCELLCNVSASKLERGLSLLFLFCRTCANSRATFPLAATDEILRLRRKLSLFALDANEDACQATTSWGVVVGAVSRSPRSSL